MEIKLAAVSTNHEIDAALDLAGFQPDLRVRVLNAAAAIADEAAAVPADPAAWLAAVERHPAVATLTRYTAADLTKRMGERIEEIVAQRALAGVSAPVQLPPDFDADEPYLRPFALVALEAGFGIKRVLEFGEDGSVGFDGYEAVSLFSNEGSCTTGVLIPVMLFLIGFKAEKRMRGDCYDVLREGAGERGTGKLPTLYTQFGAVKTAAYEFDATYLADTQEAQAAAVAKLEEVWRTPLGGSWIPQRDERGVVRNYPDVWNFELNLTADQRRQIASAGIAGYLDDPGRIRRLAESNAGTALQCAGSGDTGQPVPTDTWPPCAAQVPVQAGTSGLPQAARALARRDARGVLPFVRKRGHEVRLDLTALAYAMLRTHASDCWQGSTPPLSN